MLHSAVRTFAEDLQNISETIKERTVQQIKTALKKKVIMIMIINIYVGNIKCNSRLMRRLVFRFRQ